MLFYLTIIKRRVITRIVVLLSIHEEEDEYLFINKYVSYIQNE